MLAIQRNLLDFTLAFDLRPDGEGTRLVSRVRARLRFPGGRVVERFGLGPGDGIMVRKQLLELIDAQDERALDAILPAEVPGHGRALQQVFEGNG